MIVKDHFLTQEEFEIREARPGILETVPLPDNLDKYYESEEYISHHQEDRSLKTRIYKLIQQFNLRYKKKIVDRACPSGKYLLDYGCGVGSFLAYIRKDYKVTGIEPNSSARKAAADLIGAENLKNSLSEIEDESLDVASLWHVFEHIADPEDFLNKIHKKLKRKGKLIIAVPNYQSYDALHYQGFWAAYDIPRHLFHFSPKGMKNLFKNQQWQLKENKPLYFDAFYISILSEQYKNNSLPWLRGAYYGTLSNIKALRSGNFSSLIYIIEKQ